MELAQVIVVDEEPIGAEGGAVVLALAAIGAADLKRHSAENVEIGDRLDEFPAGGVHRVASRALLAATGSPSDSPTE